MPASAAEYVPIKVRRVQVEMGRLSSFMIVALLGFRALPVSLNDPDGLSITTGTTSRNQGVRKIRGKCG